MTNTKSPKILTRSGSVFGGAAGVLSFSAVNGVHYLVNKCPEGFDDCGYTFGLPFEIYLAGSIFHYDDILWRGVLLNALFAALMGITVAAMVSWFRQRRQIS